MNKHYQFSYKGIKLDPYRILKVYGISDPAQQHAIKKLLRAGESVKSLKEDLEEVVLSLTRWLEMLEEDSDESSLEEWCSSSYTADPSEIEHLFKGTILTVDQIFKALRQGYKLSCKNWDEDEYIVMKNGEIFDETDRKYSDEEFDQILNDWDLYMK